jgi:hypothetical protein
MKLIVGRYVYKETPKRMEREIQWEELGDVESFEFFDYGVADITLKIILKETKGEA